MSVAQTEIVSDSLRPHSSPSYRSFKYSRPHVAILLGTHCGASFLTEQLDSITKQSYKNLRVWASDDGSDDGTQDLLAQYQSSWEEGCITIRSGPKQGFVSNFLSLICNPDMRANYFAFCDQDDLWETDKLTKALSALNDVPHDIPALYCSRTKIVDENGRLLKFSPLFQKPPSFANALVQNIGGGNTMVMNKAARNLLCKAGMKNVVSHDWWTYQLISGAGGTVIYDPHPSILYRQHGNNHIGANSGWLARLKRLRLLLQGRFEMWNTTNIKALTEVEDLLTAENRHALKTFGLARKRCLAPRIWGIWQSGVYRQTLMGNLGLIAATLLKKL